MQRRTFFAVVGAAIVNSAARAKIGNIELGVCADAAHFDSAVRYGFDYYELEVAEIAQMDDEQFAALKERVLASPIRCRAFRSFIRRLQVVGENASAHEDELKDYLEQNLDRCRQLGGRIVVWGSAGSRNVPGGFERDKAWQQIQSFLHVAGDIAQQNNLIIAIEPLRKQESNIINTAEQALR
jgi:sugar phosphate isomerase/epimerase